MNNAVVDDGSTFPSPLRYLQKEDPDDLASWPHLLAWPGDED